MSDTVDSPACVVPNFSSEVDSVMAVELSKPAELRTIQRRDRVRDSNLSTAIRTACRGTGSYEEIGKENEFSLSGNNDAKENERHKESKLMPTTAQVVAYLKDYCNSTAIHGVRYFAEDGRYLIEKFFWAVALFICGLGCFYTISKIKEKLDTTPVIVTFAESATNIWHISFPAVTVCPLSKSRQTAFNFTKYANIVVEDVDLHHDYMAWLEKTYDEIVFGIYHDEYITDYLDDNTTWIEQKYLWNTVFYDYASTELKSLLHNFFALIVNDEPFFHHGVENSSWIESKFKQMIQDESFRKKINDFYPVWTEDIYQKLRSLQTVCRAEERYWSSVFRGMEENSALYLDDAVMNFLRKVAPYMGSEGYSLASWDVHTSYPNAFFRALWTEEGLCYTFNMMDNDDMFRDQVITNADSGNHLHRYGASKSWDSDIGYSPTAGRDAYPRRPLGVGSDSGLQMSLAEDPIDIDYLCHKGGVSGYKIILHSPENFPQLQLDYEVNVPFMKDISIIVKPSLMSTSPGLEKYEPHKRQCYFSHEKHLYYFKKYTKNNCELECLTNATLKFCGCVAFYMPRHNGTKICGRGSAFCVDHQARRLVQREIDNDLDKHSKQGGSSFSLTITESECDCLPSCVSIEYDANVNIIELDMTKFEKASQAQEREDVTYEERLSTNIEVFFKSKHFIASRRNELYGKFDFLANCGGLLGLFTGFSIVSLIEILYFLTVRMWSNFYRRFSLRRRTPEMELHR